jgi:hypothetical protein
MKRFFKLRNVIIFTIVFLVVAQTFKIDKTSPFISSSLDFIALEKPPLQFEKMIKNQCYDCHSNETKYPWYTDYAPVSWWIKSNVNGAREFFNFSEWGKLSKKEKITKMQECFEALKEEEMPVALYIMMHDNAQFSENENDSLMNWFKNFQVK